MNLHVYVLSQWGEFNQLPLNWDVSFPVLLNFPDNNWMEIKENSKWTLAIFAHHSMHRTNCLLLVWHCFETAGTIKYKWLSAIFKPFPKEFTQYWLSLSTSHKCLCVSHHTQFINLMLFMTFLHWSSGH